MNDIQKEMLRISHLRFLDELPDGDCLVQDTESEAVRGVAFCYILTRDGAVQNIDYHYRTAHETTTG
ncbi:MAG: hypothetical protein D6736_05000 [Nitrospinota bacterium]|nr:MAG: hypothetical protein D6736_05000 [Nitrospinota bacterium]